MPVAVAGIFVGRGLPNLLPHLQDKLHVSRAILKCGLRTKKGSPLCRYEIRAGGPADSASSHDQEVGNRMLNFTTLDCMDYNFFRIRPTLWVTLTMEALAKLFGVSTRGLLLCKIHTDENTRHRSSQFHAAGTCFEN